ALGSFLNGGGLSSGFFSVGGSRSGGAGGSSGSAFGRRGPFLSWGRSPASLGEFGVAREAPELRARIPNTAAQARTRTIAKAMAGNKYRTRSLLSERSLSRMASAAPAPAGMNGRDLSPAGVSNHACLA